jgi:hypothetical protein
MRKNFATLSVMGVISALLGNEAVRAEEYDSLTVNLSVGDGYVELGGLGSTYPVAHPTGYSDPYGSHVDSYGITP